MEKNGIDIINIFDPEYPQILKEIYDPPICLYIKGNKKILNSFALAIIGCRDSSVYGEKNAEKFAFELAKRKIVIVSGLAKGIDSCAHKGTVLAKEKTIAVIGNGLDFIYPSENTKLANEIIKNDGCIISEYPLGTKPEKQNFPARNRIISGISKGVLVVEAKEKSGTLITVDFALEQGRDVFALPGNINSLNSVGTNELIKQGASIVCNVEDVLQGLKTL
jgi:DNA processing protein